MKKKMLKIKKNSYKCVAFLIIACNVLVCSSNANDRIYSPRADYQFKAGSRIINRLHFLIPVIQKSDSLLFTDAIAMADSDGRFEGNFGFGYRKLFPNNVFGGYGFFDARRSQYANDFYQITVGAEVLFARHEYRINFYVPISGKKFIGNFLDIKEETSDRNSTLSSGLVFKNGSKYDVPRHGLDIEGGLSLLNNPRTLNLYGAFYYFGYPDEDVKNMLGGRLRLNWQPLSYLAVEAETNYDNIRKFKYYLGLKLSYHFDNKYHRYEQKTVLQQKMTSFVERDIDIVTTSEELDVDAIVVPSMPVGTSAVFARSNGELQLKLHGEKGNVDRYFIYDTDYRSLTTSDNGIHDLAKMSQKDLQAIEVFFKVNPNSDNRALSFKSSYASSQEKIKDEQAIKRSASEHLALIEVELKKNEAKISLKTAEMNGAAKEKREIIKTLKLQLESSKSSQEIPAGRALALLIEQIIVKDQAIKTLFIRASKLNSSGQLRSCASGDIAAYIEIIRNKSIRDNLHQLQLSANIVDETGVRRLEGSAFSLLDKAIVGYKKIQKNRQVVKKQMKAETSTLNKILKPYEQELYYLDRIAQELTHEKAEIEKHALSSTAERAKMYQENFSKRRNCITSPMRMVRFQTPTRAQ